MISKGTRKTDGTALKAEKATVIDSEQILEANSDLQSPLKHAILDLHLSGMVLKGSINFSDLHLDPAKSVKAQLINLISQGRMLGINIYRDSESFDPKAMTEKLELYGFTPPQVNRFMRNMYKVPVVNGRGDNANSENLDQ